MSAKAVDVTRAVREICQLQDCLPLAATALGRAVASTTLVADGGLNVSAPSPLHA